MQRQSIVVVKIGGSVLTRMHASGPDLHEERLAALLPDLRNCNDAVVLVHGSGSFGKPPALKYGYLGGKLGADRAATVSAVSADLERLHAALLERLRQADLAPASLGVSPLFAWQRQRVTIRHSRVVRECCERGLLPVVGSGFVADHDTGGFAICSSDAMAARLAIALEARALVFATDAAGVCSDYPHNSRAHESLAPNDAALSGVRPAAADVTGGMAEKLRYGFLAANSGIATHVIDGRVAGNLAATLQGRPLSGTRLLPSRRSQASTAFSKPLSLSTNP